MAAIFLNVIGIYFGLYRLNRLSDFGFDVNSLMGSEIYHSFCI